MNCTRRLTFSAGHRVLGHEGKCQFPHGHNYVAEITAEAIRLDPIGRVVDFSVIKRVVGEWIEQNWDHAFLVNTEDTELLEVFAHHPKWKLAVLPYNPTAENMAKELLLAAAGLIAKSQEHVRVIHVRLWETENCWADAVPGE